MDILNFSKSKLRSRILQLYFAHPEKKYYLRELERLLKKPVAYIRRELLGLKKSGLFISNFSGKQRYFELNKNYYLYEEIKKIVFKTVGTKGSLKTILENIQNIKIAFIFGSLAKGEEDYLSDIDIMIIGNPDEDKLISDINKLENKLNREINYHIYSSLDVEQNIKKNNSFIKNVLSGQKIFLIGDQNELSEFNQKKSAQKRKR